MKLKDWISNDIFNHPRTTRKTRLINALKSCLQDDANITIYELRQGLIFKLRNVGYKTAQLFMELTKGLDLSCNDKTLDDVLTLISELYRTVSKIKNK